MSHLRKVKTILSCAVLTLLSLSGCAPSSSSGGGAGNGVSTQSGGTPTGNIPVSSVKTFNDAQIFYSGARDVTVTDVKPGALYDCRVYSNSDSKAKTITNALNLGLNPQGAIRNEGTLAPAVANVDLYFQVADYVPTEKGYISANGFENPQGGLVTNFFKLKTDGSNHFVIGLWGQICDSQQQNCQTSDIGTISVCQANGKNQNLQYEPATPNLDFGDGGTKAYKIPFVGEPGNFHALSLYPQYNESHQLTKVVLSGINDNQVYLNVRNPDGSPDSSFGKNGVLSFDPGCSVEFGSNSIVQMDSAGDYFVAIDCNSSTGTVETSRTKKISKAGVIDAGFGAGLGFFEIPVGPAQDYQIKVLASGKILVYSDQGKAALYRFNADGTRDSSFGVAGKLAVSFPAPSMLDSRTDISGLQWVDFDLQHSDQNSSTCQVSAGKFSEDGRPDTNVSASGLQNYTLTIPGDVYIGWSGPFDTFSNVGLLVGSSYPHQLTLYHLNSDFSFDKGFGRNGFVQFASANSDVSVEQGIPTSELTLEDGSVIVGRAHARGVWLAKVSSTGEIDTAFSASGSRNLYLNLAEGEIADLLIDPSSNSKSLKLWSLIDLDDKNAQLDISSVQMAR